jgi:hypothetical protein
MKSASSPRIDCADSYQKKSAPHFLTVGQTPHPRRFTRLGDGFGWGCPLCSVPKAATAVEMSL